MRYWAFISYSSGDRRTAAWLHRRLEGYSIPKQLRGASLREGLVIGRKLRPVFRDRDELPSTADLGETISAALRDSWCLIVLCSSSAAASQWVNTEIKEFRELGRGDRIFPLIVGGEPNAARPEEECFPPALRDRGVDTLGGDLRPEGDGRERSLIKILAAILEVDFDQLYRRHERITRRRWAIFGGLASALALVLGALAFYAFDQKQVADAERYRAESNEKKANQRKAEAEAERDAARKSAARAFFERAKATVSRSDKLAWALRGIDEDTSLLGEGGVSARLQHWLGPHVGPTSVEPTGVEWGPYSGRVYERNFHVSRTHKRILLRPPWQRWQLYAWDLGKTLTRGSVDDSIHVPRRDGKWFFVSTEKNIEARRWEDGTIVSTAARPPGHMTGVAVVGDEVLVAMHETGIEPGREPGSVYTWRFRDGAHRLVVIPDTRGRRISQIDVIPTTPEHDILLTWDYVSDRLGWYERTTGNTWEPSEIEIESAERMTLGGWKFPPGAREANGVVLELYTDEQDVSHVLVDLKDPRRALLVGDEIKGVRRAGDTLVAIHNVAVIDRASKSTKIYAEELPLNGRRPTRLHGGEAVSQTVVGRLSGTVVSQGHNPTDLFIRSQDGTESRRTIFLHRDPILESVEEIQPRIFVKTTRRSDDAFIVIDLDDPGPGLVRGGTAFAFHTVLDVFRRENGLAAAVLSHSLAGISRFDNLPSLTSVETLDAFDGDWISPRDQHRVELSMLSVNNKGVIDALVGTTDLDTEFQRVRSDQSVPGPRIQTKYVRNQPEVAIRQDDRGHLLLPNRPARVLNTAGETIWTGNRRTTAWDLLNVSGQAAVLVEQRDAIEALNVESGTPLWSHPFPEDSLLSTSTGDVAIDREHGKIQVLRHQSDSLGLILVQLSLPDGTLVSETRWSPDNNDNEKLESPFRHPFRHFAHPTALTLLLSEQEGLLIDWDDNRGSVAMRWPTKVSQLPATWFLPVSHALIVDRVGESGLDLARVSRREGGWVVNDERIELDGALVWSVVHPFRDIALLTSEGGTILWDFEANRRINTRLHSANGNAVLDAKGAIWANDGSTFFIWDDHTIRHYSSAGDFLGVLWEHEQYAYTTINKVALSPSGKWIVSGDDQGRVIRTEVRTPKQLTPSELRRAVHGIGGYVIKDNGPARWKPGELTVPRTWAPLVPKLTELVRGTSAP